MNRSAAAASNTILRNSSSSSRKATADVFRALARGRRSADRFETGRRIPAETIRDILKSTLRSPSSFNLQPTQIVLVQNQTVKDELSARAMLGAGNQYRVRDCSALAVFCSDLQAGKRIQRIHELEKQWGGRHPDYAAYMPLNALFLLGEGHAATWIKQRTTDVLSAVQTQRPMPTIDPVQAWAYKNTALSVQSYVLAATSHDLATSIMEGFDARRIKRQLCIPDRYDIPMVVATGYEYYDHEKSSTSSHDLTPRLDMEDVVFSDSFGERLSLENDDHDEGQDEWDDGEETPFEAKTATGQA